MEHEEEQEQDSNPEQWPGPQTTSLDDIEDMVSAPEASNVLDTELRGEGVPEEFAGRKFADVLSTLSNLKSALKTSEEARTQAMLTAQTLAETRAQPTAPAAPLSAAPVERNAEQWRELYDTDPFKYQEERFAALEKRLVQGVDARVAPMASASVVNAEQTAKAQYQEEFQVLGKEIKDFVAQAFPSAEAKQMLSDPEAWGRVVKYVKGENVDKWISHKQGQAQQNAATQRRQAESEAAPPTFSTSRNGPQGRPPVRGKMSPANMDDTSKEIARNLMPELPPAKAYEEYCKHYV